MENGGLLVLPLAAMDETFEYLVKLANAAARGGTQREAIAAAWAAADADPKRRYLLAYEVKPVPQRWA